jgi:hypothetical protein
MLEAERAGAKALVVFMDAFQRNSEHWMILRRVQAEEAHNCALIGKLLEARGTPYSHDTGEFYGKAVAVQGSRQRIEFLVRGLRWAVRQFDAALPRMADAEVRRVFEGMKATHERSIAACEAVAQSLPR